MSKQIQLTSGMSRYTIQYYKSVEEIKQLFYVEPMITTIEELKEFINQQTNKEQRYWRGLNDGSFTILAKSYVDFCQKELFNIYDNYNRYLQRIWDMAKADTILEDIHKHQTKGIEQSQYTPLWALTFIQHYATGTPLIDWTNDIWSALYFAWNGAKPSPRISHKLSDYIQLNFFDYDTHIAQPSVPKGEQKDSPAHRMTKPTQINADLEELRQQGKDQIITIDSFCSYKWSCVGSYEETGTSYRNDRSDKQHGFFILHLEDCETLEEKWNRIFKEDTFQNPIARYDAVDKMQLHKVLIHKSLVPYIEGLLKEHWGGENLNEILLPQKYVVGYNLCQIAQHIIEEAQTKA